ncbi:hypothetical protein ACIGPN_22950 [Streptomyces afghaniensis]|uniref:hypothetical protein n=1 Tax=Streptomyces TaxID=1883 RepID=UPI001FAFFC7B|nr:hypothetical protein [Streptomyces sp. HP-A2021]UOB13628.1 hypothetical protein MQE23_33255 [Streptomyces sp. HP-A2021]
MTSPGLGRITGRRLRAPLLTFVVLLLSGVAACSDGGTGEGPSTPGSRTRAATPRDLVGAWESAQPGSNTTLAYRFTDEGKYKYFGMTSYPMGQEVYQLIHVVEGTYEASTDALVLKPHSATLTRKNPENPERDFTSSPAPFKTERFEWKIADRELSLIREDETRFTFRWVSE